MKNSREGIETEQRTELSTPGIGWLNLWRYCNSGLIMSLSWIFLHPGVEYLGKLGAPANYQGKIFGFLFASKSWISIILIHDH
jgi:hypothetical protein